MNANTIKKVMSVALIGGALVFLFDASLWGSVDYFYSVDELEAKRGELSGQRIRLGGLVQDGSIYHRGEEIMFTIRPVPKMVKHPEHAGAGIRVRYRGVVPDTFKAKSEAVVTGRLRGDGVFVGEELLAKCPSKEYAAEDEGYE